MNDNLARGGEYIVWDGLDVGGNNRDVDDADIITTAIQIRSAGTYSFQWLMR